MLEKIKKIYKHSFIQELKDVRVLGLLVFCIMVLLVSWSGVRVIEANYKLQQQVARMEEETKIRRMENANKKLENEYFQSDYYLELQARKLFGKAALGETVLTVPENVAMANTIDHSQDNEKSAGKNADKPFYQKNFEDWMNFFFHRSSSSS